MSPREGQNIERVSSTCRSGHGVTIQPRCAGVDTRIAADQSDARLAGFLGRCYWCRWRDLWSNASVRRDPAGLTSSPPAMINISGGGQLITCVRTVTCSRRAEDQQLNPSLPTGWTRTRPSISIGKAHTSTPGCRASSTPADRKGISAASGTTATTDRPEEAAPEDPGDEVGGEQQGRHHHAEAE
jgi:hypothetical protein